MKKITTLLLLFVAALVAVMPSFADEHDDLINLYPYDNPNNMTASESIAAGTIRVGDSFWRMEFLGYRYHFVNNSVRYAHKWVDANADGVYAPTDYPALSWNAFAQMIINDGEDEIEMSTESARTDMTTVVQRIYSYFNEDGELAMLEDHFFQYYIHNDGTDTTDNAEWRYATEAEIDAFEAAETPAVDTPNTRFSPVRVIKDDTDPKGYVMEPIGYLTWRNPDLSALPQEEQSLLVDWNPNHVVIPAGWTVVSFGTNDRASYTSTDLVKLLGTAFVAEETPTMNKYFDFPAPAFTGLTALDDDAATPGVQIIVEFNQADFDLPNTVGATWINMFDEAGLTINRVDKIDYTVDIYDSADFNSAEEDHVPTVLQSITFTYDSVADAYTPSAALTVVDSSVFGAGYVAVYSAEHPEDGYTEIEVQIAVGVLPPRFENVRNRFADEAVFVDLLGNITANDGYGNDKTSDIQITAPAGFNIYNPKPGTYTINLEFTHNVFIAGVPATPDTLQLGANTINVTRKNENFAAYGLHTTLYTEPLLYTNTAFQGWVVVEFAADGTMVKSVERNTWNAWDENGAVAGVNDAYIKNWLENIDFSLGGYVVFFGQTADRPVAAALRFGDSVPLTEGSAGVPDFSKDIVTTASYQLTIDDRTAPQVVIVDNNYSIEADKFSTAQAAILANVVAIDNFDSRTELSIYVASTGGLAVSGGRLVPGTYTVIVGVDDRAGNSSEVSFTVTVRPARLTQEEIEQAIEERVEERVEEAEAQIPQDTITPDEVDAAIEQAIEDALASYDGVGVLTAVLMSLGAALVSFGGAALLFFLKKK